MADIPVGGGTVFPERATVVTQPQPGQFRAFSAICPHRGCAVTTVDDDAIICPCHGSRFRTSDGAVTNGPAEQPLEPRTITATATELRIS
ncbi:Rieske (2Fe-2S) protein [Nocardia cyriacigeorgica]|nr:Rieske (2Fe-2S) protein [Nocardia cyriacigeorgica]